MKYIVLITIFLLLITCGSKTKYEKPHDLISRAKMIDLLVDLHLGVSARNIQNKNLKRNQNYLVLVFEKHEVDSLRFAASNTYYMSNVEGYEDMFEEVQQRLQELRDIYDLEKDTLDEINKRIREYENRADKIGRGELVK